MQHIPVLRDKLIGALVTRSDGIYVDATYGRGGHTRALLDRLSDKARVIAIDRDPVAVESANALASSDDRIIPIHSTFANLKATLVDFGSPQITGAMLDVGVSSPQLNDAERGFSFRLNGPLDMRMDTTKGTTAADWLATVEENELARVIWEFGQERQSRPIARAIIKARPVVTTEQLANAIVKASSKRYSQKHPATRTFQAIRIYINDELEELKKGIEAIFEHLEPLGRLAVITFQSLEHAIVRKHFRDWVKPSLPRRLPVRGMAPSAAKFVLKATRPSGQEIYNNPRARSALLQAIEKSEVKKEVGN